MENNRATKSYDEKLLNVEFAWYRNSFSQADTVNSVPYLINKDMIREPTSEMKNGKAAGTSGSEFEIEKQQEKQQLI